MKANWWYRFIFLALVIIVSAITVTPTIFKLGENSKFPVKSKVNLGLDLQGGLYMIMGIDFKKVYVDEVKTYLKKVESSLKDQGIESTIGDMDTSDGEDPKQMITITDTTQVEKAKTLIHDYYREVLRLTASKDGQLQFGLQRMIKDDIEKNSVSKSIEVIRNRIDEFGVSEPEINSQGKDRIVVQLPGVKDIERAKALIGKTAKLEFKMVNDEVAGSKLMEWMEKVNKAGIAYKKGDRFSVYVAQVNDHLRTDLPAGYEIAFQKMEKTTDGVEQNIPFLVESVAGITGEDLQDAAVRIDQQNNRPYVGITFKASGSKRFEELTEKNVGKRMAVILDGNVYTAPVINQKIAGGNAMITLGNGDYNALLGQAKDIALVLRAGALPVQLDFEEQRVVGPSLGTDSIENSKMAAFLGCGIVFIFMLIYYKMAGAIAIFTLLVNVLICLAFMVGIGATLTLPGIGGLALTVGMAVDANIIIYERIKDELLNGASNVVASDAGFDKAFWSILDGNLTTAFAGIALLNFGTGPIRGFAVTLLIGIAATVYTGYFVTQLMFELYVTKANQKIKI